MSDLQLRNVTLAYGSTTAVRNVDLHVEAGEFVTMLGPSGSGKTSVLRMVGGYVQPDSGQILLGDRDVTRLPPRQRNIGMVFQHYALFPHLTVAENVAFGLKARRQPKDEIQRRVHEALEQVHLKGYGGRLPGQLSGGQQQRVALARAIAIRPSLLLMDEPLGALDARLRESVQIEIRRLQRELNITTLYVTHDQNEAFSMSDRIVIMHEGDVVTVGSPEGLYKDPQTAFAADFIGHSAVLPITIEAWNGTAGTVRVAGHPELVVVEGSRPDGTGDCHLMIRPDGLRLSAEPVPGRSLQGTVLARRFSGAGLLLTVDVGVARVVVTDSSSRFDEGQVVHVTWATEAVKLLAQ